MKPKWGDISKYMALDNLNILPFKLHVYVHKKFLLFSAATHEWATSVFLYGCAQVV